MASSTAPFAPSAPSSDPGPLGIGLGLSFGETQVVTPGAAVGLRVEPAVPSRGAGLRGKRLAPRQIAETTFWAPQLKEQCLFLFLGLEPNPAFPAGPLQPLDARELQKASEEENARLILKLRQRCKELVLSWLGFERLLSEGSLDVTILNNLLNHTLYAQSRIGDLQAQKVWVGSLSPGWVAHMRKTLEYFVQRFNGQLEPDRERLFWSETDGDVLALAAHELDIGYASRPLMDRLLDLSDEALRPIAAAPKEDLLQVIALSRRFPHQGYATRALALLTEARPVLEGAAHPVLVAHLLREAGRALQRQTELGPPALLRAEGKRGGQEDPAAATDVSAPAAPAAASGGCAASAPSASTAPASASPGAAEARAAGAGYPAWNPGRSQPGSGYEQGYAGSWPARSVRRW
jgi:hypothetical protein